MSNRNLIKIICLILTLSMLTVMSFGCTSPSNSNDETEPVTTEANATELDTEAEDSESIDDSDTTAAAALSGDGTYSISDVKVYEDDNCAFYVKGAYDQDFWGFTLKVYCENRTEDTSLCFAFEDMSVNGYAVSGMFTEDVAPGESGDYEALFEMESFENFGITSPDAVSFRLRVYNYDDWEADDYVNDMFTVYPTGLTADQIVVPERKTTEDEVVVIDNEYCTFIILGLEIDEGSGSYVNCYIENKSDVVECISWDDVKVNGIEFDPYFAKYVQPGIRCYCDVSFYKSDLELAEITAIEKIDYTLRVYEADDFFGDDFINKSYTYEP